MAIGSTSLAISLLAISPLLGNANLPIGPKQDCQTLSRLAIFPFVIHPLYFDSSFIIRPSSFTVYAPLIIRRPARLLL